MAEGYWTLQSNFHPSSTPQKRPRSDYALPPSAPSGHEMLNYLPRDNPGVSAGVKDTKSIGASYDRYLQNAHMPSFSAGEARAFSMGESSNLVRPGVGPSFPGQGSGMGEPVLMVGPGASGSDLLPNGRNVGFSSRPSMDPIGRPGLGPELPLPPDASDTLYVEGLPSDCTKREVAHIFRPFLGFKEVRLVKKDAKHKDGDQIVLCFVDFANANCAATALCALQGYKMDEEPDAPYLRLQFARHPGPKSGHSSRRKR